MFNSNNIDDSDLDLLMNKEKLKDTSNTSINIVKEESNPFNLESSNPIIGNFEGPSEQTSRTENINITIDNTNDVKVEDTPLNDMHDINVESFNTPNTRDSFQRVSPRIQPSFMSRESSYEYERAEKAKLLNKFDFVISFGFIDCSNSFYEILIR